MAVMFSVYRPILCRTRFKSKISNEGNVGPTILTKHSLALVKGESQRFLDSLGILKPAGEGDNFRYIKSEDGNRHYNGELMNVLSSLSLFVESDEIKKTGLFTCQLNKNDKMLKHEWTLYTTDTQTLGHLKTQYDDLISTLLHAIKSGDLNIADIYLPLLFLIRHSLELGYKDNIAEVQTKLTNSQIKKATQSHSLVSLNNIIEQFVVEARSTMTAKDDSIKNEIDRYLPIVKNLSNNLHAIDNASRSFRFPIDRDGNTIKIPLSEDILAKSVDAFQNADSFISLSLSV